MNIFRKSIVVLLTATLVPLIIINFYTFMVATFGRDADFLGVFVDVSFAQNRYFGFTSFLLMLEDFPIDQAVTNFIEDLEYFVNYFLFGIPREVHSMYENLKSVDEYTKEIIQNVTLTTVVKIMTTFLMAPLFILVGVFKLVVEFFWYVLEIIQILAYAFAGKYSIPFEETYEFIPMLLAFR